MGSRGRSLASGAANLLERRGRLPEGKDHLAENGQGRRQSRILSDRGLIGREKIAGQASLGDLESGRSLTGRGRLRAGQGQSGRDRVSAPGGHLPARRDRSAEGGLRQDRSVGSRDRDLRRPDLATDLAGVARNEAVMRRGGLSGRRVNGRSRSRAAHRGYVLTAHRTTDSTRLRGKAGRRGQIGHGVRDHAMERAGREEAVVRSAEETLRDLARNRERDGRSRHLDRSRALGPGPALGPGQA